MHARLTAGELAHTLAYQLHGAGPRVSAHNGAGVLTRRAAEGVCQPSRAADEPARSVASLFRWLGPMTLRGMAMMTAAGAFQELRLAHACWWKVEHPLRPARALHRPGCLWAPKLSDPVRARLPRVRETMQDTAVPFARPCAVATCTSGSCMPWARRLVLHSMQPRGSRDMGAGTVTAQQLPSKRLASRSSSSVHITHVMNMDL